MALFLARLLILIVLVVVALVLLRRRFRGGPRPLPDPYRILGVEPGATAEELREAYHRELSKYHPDKVAHLGEDLKELARARTSDIIEAYRQLTRTGNGSSSGK